MENQPLITEITYQSKTLAVVAKAKARSLGFVGEPQTISDTIHRFTNPNFPSQMEMNIVTGIFSISYDLNADRTPLEKKPPVAEVAASLFRSLLSNADILPSDLTGPTDSEFFKLSEGKFVTALSLSEADAVKVNLFRKNYDEKNKLLKKEEVKIKNLFIAL